MSPGSQELWLPWRRLVRPLVTTTPGYTVRRSVLAVTCLGLVAGGSLAPAQAAPPKSFSKTVTFVDATPDPTAFFLGPEHCMGRLPAEDPVVVDLPGPGKVDIAISGFTGEWSLMVTNPKGSVIAVADADAPETESLTLKVKKAGKISILPCNIAGTFEATITYSYTYKK